MIRLAQPKQTTIAMSADNGVDEYAGTFDDYEFYSMSADALAAFGDPQAGEEIAIDGCDSQCWAIRPDGMLIYEDEA